jgi:uncharacterized protein YxjI
MHYPLTLSFKIAALAPQLSARDAESKELLYVKQKLLKLKDKINVFADSSQSQQLYEINADRVLDFSARFTFTDPLGNTAGAVQRQGGKSLWKATYEVFAANGGSAATIQEENPWVKVLDALVNEIPIVNIFTGYLLNPKYLVTEAGTQRPLLRITKSRSFLESKFTVDRLDAGASNEAQDTALLLAIMTMVLHERRRG